MGEAQTAAMNMIDKLKDAGGIFCPNESSTMGMLLALQQNGLAKKVLFIGFDASPPLLDAVRSRSEEHTSELQSPCNLVCRLLLEKKKKNIYIRHISRLDLIHAHVSGYAKALLRLSLLAAPSLARAHQPWRAAIALTAARFTLALP